MTKPRPSSFFRLVKNWPPSDRDYRTKFDKHGEPSPALTGDHLIGWYGLSSYDSEEGALVQAAECPTLGRFVARYDIPESARVECIKTFGRGHWTLRGDTDELHGYLAADHHRSL